MPILILIAVRFFMRIVRAFQVLWVLVTDRSKARRLPWRYLGRRTVRDVRALVQVGGIVAVLVVYPLSFWLGDPAKDPMIAVAVVLWLLAAISPPLERAACNRS